MAGEPKRGLGVLGLVAALIYVLMISADMASGAVVDYQGLLNLTMSIEDTRIDAQDLAFLLATHDFEAMPEGDYVIVKLDDAVYKMTPNKDKPGLADINLMN